MKTRAETLADENLSLLAKLLAVELSLRPRRVYSSGELGRILGVPGSFVADAGRELSHRRFALCYRHPEASRIEWSPQAWTTETQPPTSTATKKGSSRSSAPSASASAALASS